MHEPLPLPDPASPDIGRTPLVRLDRVVRRCIGAPRGVAVYAKAEHLNPGGSVKDRAALAMILAGEESGALVPGKTILDATSGNTGIAYALVGARRGWPVAVCLPANASEGRKRILRALGATILETDPLTGTDGAQERARALAREAPGRWFWPNQYDNPANWRAHFATTGPEIWEQTRGRVTHFVAGVGTGGTFVGTGRALRARAPGVRLVAVHPDAPLHGIEGLKHLPTARVPGIWDPALPDAAIEVATARARAMARLLALEEGLAVGTSAGANVHAALEVARGLAPGAVVVTILCDGADRDRGPGPSPGDEP